MFVIVVIQLNFYSTSTDSPCMQRFVWPRSHLLANREETWGNRHSFSLRLLFKLILFYLVFYIDEIYQFCCHRNCALDIIIVLNMLVIFSYNSKILNTKITFPRVWFPFRISLSVNTLLNNQSCVLLFNIWLCLDQSKHHYLWIPPQIAQPVSSYDEWAQLNEQMLICFFTFATEAVHGRNFSPFHNWILLIMARCKNLYWKL